MDSEGREQQWANSTKPPLHTNDEDTGSRSDIINDSDYVPRQAAEAVGEFTSAPGDGDDGFPAESPHPPPRSMLDEDSPYPIESEARESLTTYVAICFQKGHTPHEHDDLGRAVQETWQDAVHYRVTGMSKEDILARINKLNQEEGGVVERKLKITDCIQAQLERAYIVLETQEWDRRFQYTLAQFDKETRKVVRYEPNHEENTHARDVDKRLDPDGSSSKSMFEPSKPNGRNYMQTVSVTAYFKRQPGEHFNCRQLLHELKVREEQREQGNDGRAGSLGSALEAAPCSDSGHKSRSRVMASLNPAQIVTAADSAYGSGPVLASDMKNLTIIDASAGQPGTEEVELDLDDTGTVYSDASSATSVEKQTYIWELAESIYGNLDSMMTDSDTPRRIYSILPALLQEFALILGYGATTQKYRDVMVFVHRHRHAITSAFEYISLLPDDEPIEQAESPLDYTSLEERISDWWERTGQEIPLESDSDSEQQGDSREDEQLSWYSDVLDTEGYRWLLSQLQKEVRLAVPAGADAAKSLRQTIRAALPGTRRVSRKVSPSNCLVQLQLDWDVYAFFERQGYENPPDEVFDHVITLTGSDFRVQATSTSQYIRQTWSTAGEECSVVFKEALRLGNETGRWARAHLSNGTALGIRCTTAEVHLEIKGLASSVVEIAEQFVWLGSALRNSPLSSGLVYSTPILIDLGERTDSVEQAPPPNKVPDCLFKVTYSVEAAVEYPAKMDGDCWVGLFQNPVIANGYPIPRRAEGNIGLEMPLSMMAGLVGTRQVDRFKDRLYLKGFSAMMVPTKVAGGLLSWHLICNKNGSRLSYHDDPVGLQQSMSWADLENYRHVLGWCTEANLYAGSAHAEYLVTHTWLPRPHMGCIFHKTSVFRGMVIKGGPSFYIGSKDCPVHLVRNGFIPRLRWLANKLVLLWDEEDKRGWLVNGTSALLHLVRASLAQEQNDGFQSEFLFKTEDLQESANPFKTTSAVDVLKSHHNQQIRLYAQDDNIVSLKSRIDHFLSIMEKLIDHQSDISRHNRGDLSSSPRGLLECWDFEDLAKSPNADEIHPRVARLEPAGKGWVDFVRAADVLTLAGCGFGDVIRPANHDVCARWYEVPKGQYYLAVCLADLGELAKQQGLHEDGHIHLSDNLIWYAPTGVSGPPCHCNQSPCEPIQTFCPSELSHILAPRKYHHIPYKGSGAVIFGYSSKFPWIWGDSGLPQQGELLGTHPVPRSDSGVGQSLASTASEDDQVASRRDSETRPSSSLTGGASPTGLRTIPLPAPCPQYSTRRYKIGIICALPKELMAVRLLFDRTHKHPDSAARNEINHYVLGEMGHHMIVAACLPSGENGTNSAAAVANNLARSFPLRFCLLVGIGGGVPTKDDGLRLGDVVVGLPTGNHAGVIQYDLGADMHSGRFEPRGCLSPPPRELTTAISYIRSDPDLRLDPLRQYLGTITSLAPDYDTPRYELDPRQPCARANGPSVHYGLIGSGNHLIKSAKLRDELASGRGILCFEMEAAGVVNTLPTLVIRGICDYCDENKNDVWQEYAAATAAAYARLLLGKVAAISDEATNDSVGSQLDDWPAPRDDVDGYPRSRKRPRV